jgi:NAD-dependent dihydropyrimidine dehydrogenase PreA subunit
MAAEPHLSISGDADRRGAETAHRDPGLVQRSHARQERGAKRSSGGRRERPAREDGAQGHAFIRFHRNPQAVGLGAPRQDWRQRGVAVLGEPLDARHSGRSFSCGRIDLMHDRTFAVLQHGLPALACARCHKFDQLRLRLALRHNGCMVTLRHMAYVIVQPCVGVKDASCVEVCPVDCIHTDEAATMYFIDPDECIDCGACVDPCPVDAIFPEDEVPEQWREYIKINADYFKNRQ